MVEKLSNGRVAVSPLIFKQLGHGLLLLMPVVSLLNIISIEKIGSLNIRPADVVFVVAGIGWILCTGIQLRMSRYEIGLLLCVGLLVIVPGFASSVIPSYFVDWPRWIRFIQTMM